MRKLNIVFLAIFLVFSQADAYLSPPSSGGGGTGILELNTLTADPQYFTTGTSGTNFAISSVDDTHTFNLPDAGASARGVVTTGSQTIAGAKTFSSAPILSSLTATTVPYLNGSKALTSSAVTPTELGYLSGVSSAIQTQLGTKAPSASPTFTGTITTPLTASKVVLSNGSSQLAASTMSSTVFETLNIEQIDGMIETAADKTYVLRLKAKYGGTINEVSLKTESGTITAKLVINSTDVTGCTAISVTSTASTTSCTAANTVSSGDTIKLVTSSNSSAADLQFSVKLTR